MLILNRERDKANTFPLMNSGNIKAILHKLAREITLKVDLNQDTDIRRENRIERSKLELEAAKTQLLVTSGVVVAGGAVTEVLAPQRWCLVVCGLSEKGDN